MFFRVENLGPLREAEVDLAKALILLTGPNSTGKTYLAWSVFGLFRSPQAPGALRPVVDEILASPDQEVEFQRVRDLWPSVLDAVAKRLTDRLHLCFATTRQSFPDARITLRAAPGEPEQHGGMIRVTRLGEGIEAGIQISARLSIRPRQIREPASSALYPVALAEVPQDAREELLNRLEAALASTILAVCWPRCTLLPAERTAVDLFAKELSTGRTELLAPDKIGAYLFRGGRSETIPVTEDGFEVQTIEDEINRMNEVSQEIYAALL